MPEILTGPDRGPPAYDWRKKADVLQGECNAKRDIIAKLERELAELKRRIDNALDLIDGREDASSEDGERMRPNLEMQIGMALRGEDRP